MKAGHAAAYRQDARLVLGALGIELGADFSALPTSKVEALLVQADLRRYNKPRRANGSRARYFHDLLQRRARAGDPA